MGGLDLNSNETVYVLLIIAICSMILMNNVFSRRYFDFWSPLTMISLTYLYYAVAGPLLAISNDDTVVRFVNHRPFFEVAWLGTLLSLGGIVVGFNLQKSKLPGGRIIETPPLQIKKWAKLFFIYGFLGIIVAFGTSGITNINFIGGSEALERNQTAGSFANYFLFMMNFLIISATLLIIALKKKEVTMIWLVAVVAYAIAIYTSLGFRYRLVLLIWSMMGAYYLYIRKKPNLVLLGSFGIVFIIVMGIIGLTRTYFGGLRGLDKIDDKSNQELFESGFSEAQIFMTTGLMLTNVPDKVDNIGFQPIIEAIAMPIPRIIWPSKPSGESLQNIFAIYEVETGISDVGAGAAIMNFGENYLMFGWVGVFVGAVLLGWLSKKFWNYFLDNHNNVLYIAFYAIFNSFLYVIISRGYLPQVVMNFFFTVYPLMWVAKRQRLKYAKGRL